MPTSINFLKETPKIPSQPTNAPTNFNGLFLCFLTFLLLHPTPSLLTSPLHFFVSPLLFLSVVRKWLKLKKPPVKRSQMSDMKKNKNKNHRKQEKGKKNHREEKCNPKEEEVQWPTKRRQLTTIDEGSNRIWRNQASIQG